MPFWLVEIRRRCLGLCYSIDKLLSTFVGRPPRISRRYCSIQIPLDLDSDEYGLDGEELAKALAKLGPEGWNKDGKMRSSLWIRFFVLISLVREDILELSLGPQQNGLYELATDIARRNKAIWQQLPQHLQYRPEIWDDISHDECFYAAMQYLDIVYNDFLLQRTLVRRARARPQELLRISRLIIGTILDVINNRSRLHGNNQDIPWIVSIFSIFHSLSNFFASK